MDIRVKIATLASSRCINCFTKLEGYQVHGDGWNWLTGNVGPFCDDCYEEIRPLLKGNDDENK